MSDTPDKLFNLCFASFFVAGIAAAFANMDLGAIDVFPAWYPDWGDLVYIGLIGVSLTFAAPFRSGTSFLCLSADLLILPSGRLLAFCCPSLSDSPGFKNALVGMVFTTLIFSIFLASTRAFETLTASPAGFPETPVGRGSRAV